MAIAKRKKRFHDVEMPILNKTTQLFGYDLKDIEGRIIKYDLTRILKGKNSLLDLDVVIENKGEKEKATSEPRKFRILPSFIKRMVRNRTSYVEDSFVADCKDATLVIKPFLIARRKVSNSVKRALRKEARKEIQEYIKKMPYKAIFEDMLRNKLQKELSIKLKKIYPLSLCEIRALEVKEKNKQTENKKETEKKETQ
ncbi:MAG TPA: hypothetical protein VJ912_03830 [Candidatus Nanoarchaeia archaeon]|nr:hypothetical protein [Candidatus Nanoarchaeia archaeon]